MKSLITNDFIAFARNRFRLDWSGIHGASHWSRVRHNGLLLAEHYNVDNAVIQWFAFLHDLERRDDWTDPLHGHRAATLAAEINADFMGLSGTQLGLLQAACRGHSSGQTQADATVMVCWDADRLDLGRVGIYPDPQYLCTSFSRQAQVISGAHDRSVPRDDDSNNSDGGVNEAIDFPEIEEADIGLNELLPAIDDWQTPGY
jgi:uncharacterized protein